MAALARILFTSPLNLSVERKEFVQRMQSALEANWSRKSTLQRMPISESTKGKLGKAGLDLGTMEEIFKQGSNKGSLAMLALPSSYKIRCNKCCSSNFFNTIFVFQTSQSLSLSVLLYVYKF